MKRIAMAAGLLVIGGCTDVQKTQDDVFAKYRGQSVQAISLRWGPPEQAIGVDGGTIYTWARSSVYGSAGNVSPVSCRVRVDANFQGRVQALQATGAEGFCQSMLEELR